MKLSNLFSDPPALAKYLFIVLAALLVFLAFMSFKRVDGGNISQTIQYATYAFMMFIDAALMLVFAFRITTPNKRTYQSAVVFLVINIIATVLDQIGIVDIAFIALNAFTLYVLYVYREDFTDAAG
jgi:hypothetical protein